jgi:uncharacterized protein (DUF111 family)
MSNFSFATPFIRGFTHQDAVAGTAATTLIQAALTPARRVVVIVQNKSADATIQIIMSETGTSGILIPPLGNISFDNYNGIIRVIASADATPVHIAYALN